MRTQLQPKRLRRCRRAPYSSKAIAGMPPLPKGGGGIPVAWRGGSRSRSPIQGCFRPARPPDPGLCHSRWPRQVLTPAGRHLFDPEQTARPAGPGILPPARARHPAAGAHRRECPWIPVRQPSLQPTTGAGLLQGPRGGLGAIILKAIPASKKGWLEPASLKQAQPPCAATGQPRRRSMPGSTSGSAVTVAATRRPKYSISTASPTPTAEGSQA